MPKLEDTFKTGDRVTIGNERKQWTVTEVIGGNVARLVDDDGEPAADMDGKGGLVRFTSLRPLPKKKGGPTRTAAQNPGHLFIKKEQDKKDAARRLEDEKVLSSLMEGEKSLPPTVTVPSSPAATTQSAPTATASVSTPQTSRIMCHLKGTAPPPASTLPSDLFGPPHVEVKALAGTGKTTTVVEGMKHQRGLPTKIDPSPQQEAVWDQLKLGRSDSVMIGAFGRDIAAEVKKRLAECGLDKLKVEARTMHGMGLKAIHKAGLNVTEDPSDKNEERIVCELLNATPQQLRKDRPTLLAATATLAGHCKLNLKEATDENLDHLSSYYDVDTGNEIEKMVIYDLVPKVLERSKEPRGSISFDDMVWLPNVLNLRMWKNDILLGDEVQDWNLAQQGIARRSGYRLVLCGDEHQSIFGFAGADVQAMTRMREELSKEPRGHLCLPLTVTRRCGRAIVEEAKQYVPEFEAHEDNPDGEVCEALYPIQPDGFQRTRIVPDKDTYLPLVQDGDMVLCRSNAPLVSQCFKQISLGRNAFILGRAFGQGLQALVEKLKAGSVNDLISKLEGWRDKEAGMEQAKKFPSESRLQAIQDKHDCILTFCKDAYTPSEVVGKIDRIFADGSRPGIRHSSIHKAKGLEAQNVFFLQPRVVYTRQPKTDWEAQQERNLSYVGITRAIGSLTWVY